MKTFDIRKAVEMVKAELKGRSTETSQWDVTAGPLCMSIIHSQPTRIDLETERVGGINYFPEHDLFLVEPERLKYQEIMAELGEKIEPLYEGSRVTCITALR